MAKTPEEQRLEKKLRDIGDIIKELTKRKDKAAQDELKRQKQYASGIENELKSLRGKDPGKLR